MSIIKGLVIKDLLQLKSYKKTLIIYILIFCISSLSLENGIENMLVVMLTLGLGMFSIASFNYDEFNKVDRYILTLPVTKKEVVLSKYILVIVSTIVGSLIGIILSFSMIMLMNNSILNIEEILLTGLDGIFGAKTQEAVRSYQRKVGLSVDGIVGCNTWRALQEAVIGTGATSTTIN